MATPTTQTPSDIEQTLAAVEKRLGFVPNLYREMSASPAALQIYLQGSQALQAAHLNEKERQAAILVVSATNGCEYCQAAHSTIGAKAGLTREDLEAIRDGRDPADDSLAHVTSATRTLLEKKGWLDDDEQKKLAERGIDRGRLFDLVAIVGLKTISNYVNHLAHTEIDPQFQG